MTSAHSALLLGPHAVDLLGVAVAQHGARLRSARPVNADIRPAGGMLVQYRGEVTRADGGHSRELLVAATGIEIPAGAAVLAGEQGGAAVQVGVWRWPQDPALPGLALVAHPARVARLLFEHGLSTADTVELAVRAYRPGRRAVVEVRDGRTRWFVKVVRPGAVADLCARHELLYRCGLPVPPVLAVADVGAVVLPGVPGRPLRDLITTAEAPPPPAELERVLDALPDALRDGPVRRGPVQRVHDSAAVLCRTTRGLQAPLSEIVERIGDTGSDCAETVPVHGDFYEAQLFADGGRISGLLDVDTAGVGQRADEWATLIGHLAVAGTVNPAARTYCTAVLAHAEARVDAADLRRRTAAVLLGLATGPFRQQRPDWPALTAERLTLTRDWLAAA